MTDPLEVHAGAVVVENGRIVSVVRDRSQIPEGLRVFDVGDRPVLPGFVDPHVHVEMSATAIFGAVDCRTPPCASVGDVLDQLRKNQALREARGGWLIGQGVLYASRRFDERRLPTMTELDSISAQFPIALRFGAHVTVVNSRGMELAMEAGLPVTGDAHVCLDSSGKATGELHELFYALPIPSLTDEQLRESVAAVARERLTAHGVTAIGEITNTARGMRIMSDLAGSADLPQSVQAYVWTPGTMDLSNLLAPGFRESYDGSDYRVAGMKVFVDGGYSAHGAALLTSYVGSSSTGRMGFSEAQMTELVSRADAAGLQIAAHVNGERAQRLVCDSVVAARGGGAGIPVRLEHAGNVLTDPETAEYWARAGAVPIVQAGFIWSMGSFIAESIGAEFGPRLFPFRELIDAGWRLAGSSDVAGSDIRLFNPMANVMCATQRVTCVGDHLAPEQEVSVMEALAMHTVWAAEGLGVAHRMGSLAAGREANVVVLDRDPRVTDGALLGDIVPSAVLQRGSLVHGSLGELPAQP
ncbi:amidohydrolase [Longivirga aurantiaca]|uniref:Amidohydrolase n=1 Tax=Longivirga aurantiaca TaxID=1837743 RepID=A0ABW1SWG0_9ACTN